MTHIDQNVIDLKTANEKLEAFMADLIDEFSDTTGTQIFLKGTLTVVNPFWTPGDDHEKSKSVDINID